MKLKLVIRFNHLVVERVALPEGEYKLGRGDDCSVKISHPSIHRRHGKLAYNQNQWTYFDYTKSSLHNITDAESISLSSEIDIATEDFVAHENTGEMSQVLKQFHRLRRKKMTIGLFTSLGIVLGAVATYILVKWQAKISDPNLLLHQVRSKVVEFEREKDLEAIEDYKTLGQFKDTDFRSEFGFCTGFLVAPNVVLTALHCLSGGDFLDISSTFNVRTFDNKKFVPKKVLGFDALRDFVFLEMAGMESFGYLEFAPNYQVGETVFTLGNAHGQGIAIREGIMASETPDINDPNIRHIRYSAGASPGNSGGPLLDMQGRIVALVFAATGAENYNLGTPAKDLYKGFEKFVKNKEPKKVSIVLKRLLNFDPHQFLRRQMLPYLGDYDEYPELIEKVNNLELTFSVPMEFTQASQLMLDEVNSKSKQVVSEIEELLKSKNEVVLDWFSFLSKKTPAILYSQFDNSQNNFYKFQDALYMKVSGFIDSPGKKEFQEYLEQYKKENKFDFQAYGMNNELQPPAKGDKFLLYLPKNVQKTKRNLEDLSQGVVYSQLKVKLDPEVSDLNFKEFMKNYIGDEGVLSGIYSPFVKPQAAKNFTIQRIHKEAEISDIEDGSGRKWKRYHVKLFEVIHLYVYCFKLPQSSMCLGRVFPVENPYRLKLIEENFREKILSHFLENPYFWQEKDLLPFLSDNPSGFLASFAGSKLSAHMDSYQLKLEGFDLEFTLPSPIEFLRIQPGLFLNAKGKKSWTGYAAEWIAGKDKSKFCSYGVEPVGSQSSFIMNTMRDAIKRKQLKDNDNKVEIPKLWTKEVKSSAGDKLLLYGYCAPVRENPIELGYYFVDFKKAQPLKANYRVQ